MAGFLVAKGWTSLVASGGGDLVPAVVAAGARHVALPVGAKSPFAILANARRIAALIDREGVDVVHARSRAPAWAGWLAARHLSRRKPAFLTTFHGLYGHGNALKRSYNAVMLKGAVTIANSRHIADHIVAVYGYPRARIVIAPRGVDIAAFDPAALPAGTREVVRTELGVPPDAALLLMVGRLTRWKGHESLIRALARVDRPFVCALAGEGGDDGYRAELQQLAAAEGVADSLRFLGSRRDIAALDAAADLAFSCSIRPEAFGRVAIEAMAMGTPVIATAHGGSLETVGDGETGWLVPPGDVAAITAAVEATLGDPVRAAAMGQAGRQRVLAGFTTRATCEREFEAISRALAIHRGDTRPVSHG
ncbi:GDP-mannose-dependent alpha-(1-6)-phosphatidylinositol monomannoside mannosyltransferase [Methylobrevis pamukkalensis]|uniref:GDP-mannose-dependent alpha-(1-6)-phosphatidylinositol monomannoside mannosyltransferase n=2 Tax=Methylobrevis pamukkalensis TaxID=1439726 RepID=A0A1E3GZE0_9HYPH|nr:GDP-mannose-dependent alpha-(1-6)-phosphatidylinositol monomannoside mannosyltransferase [Methylobrevis pamukkalensis]